MSEPVLVSRDGAVLTILLNRPEVLNAFNLETANQLLKSLREAAHDETVRVVLIRGAGKAFSSGGDIKAMAEIRDHPAFFRDISQLVHDAVLQIRKMPQPVIAVCSGPVSGVAFGLATACDLRIICQSTTFHAGTTKLALAPNGGLTYFLPRLIGLGRAERVILTAEKVTARQAVEWGLADACVSTNKLDAEVKRWCEHLIQMAPLSHQKFKELLFAGDADLAEYLDREQEAISASSDTEDFREGITAFLEKRAPQFQGK
jgi:2-(1,2-epoxy-1,2-dihydrophenyl)acetyl-CoA isomerase